MKKKEMNLDTLMDTLQRRVVIPEVVQERAADAFAAIQKDAANTEQVRSSMGNVNGNRRHYRRHNRKKFVLALAAAVLIVGTISAAAAAYFRQSKSLTEGLRAAEQPEVHKKMQEEHMTTFMEQASTNQGITVTAVESITDQYFTHIAFRVEGFQVEEGKQPGFDTVKVTVDGQDNMNYGGSFYDGLVAGADGRPELADGSPVKTREDGSLITDYVMEDGSMEYQITLFHPEGKGFFMNKPIHVEMHNLGTLERADFLPGVEGTWTFDWTLEGSSKMKTCALNVPLGDSGATVTTVELSPVSLMAEYEFPRQEKQETYIDEQGKEQMGIFNNEPPALVGVLMKDGTIYPNLYRGPGFEGYESEASSTYRMVFAIDRILDVEQVKSLLFRKPYREEAKTLEEKYYIVPIG